MITVCEFCNMLFNRRTGIALKDEHGHYLTTRRAFEFCASIYKDYRVLYIDWCNYTAPDVQLILYVKEIEVTSDAS